MMRYTNKNYDERPTSSPHYYRKLIKKKNWRNTRNTRLKLHGSLLTPSGQAHARKTHEFSVTQAFTMQGLVIVCDAFSAVADCVSGKIAMSRGLSMHDGIRVVKSLNSAKATCLLRCIDRNTKRKNLHLHNHRQSRRQKQSDNHTMMHGEQKLKMPFKNPHLKTKIMTLL